MKKLLFPPQFISPRRNGAFPGAAKGIPDRHGRHSVFIVDERTFIDDGRPFIVGGRASADDE